LVRPVRSSQETHGNQWDSQNGREQQVETELVEASNIKWEWGRVDRVVFPISLLLIDGD
jgi:hypothetical protein